MPVCTCFNRAHNPRCRLSLSSLRRLNPTDFLPACKYENFGRTEPNVNRTSAPREDYLLLIEDRTSPRGDPVWRGRGTRAFTEIFHTATRNVLSRVLMNRQITIRHALQQQQNDGSTNRYFRLSRCQHKFVRCGPHHR